MAPRVDSLENESASGRADSEMLTEQQRAKAVQRAAAGDAEALQHLIVHYHATLRRAISPAAAEELRAYVDLDDVLQQAYVTAFKKITSATFDGPAAFYKWLEAVALSRLRDLERATRRQKRDVARRQIDATTTYPGLVRQLVGQESTPSQHFAKEEAIAAMMSCLARLEDDQREVVRQRFLEERAVAEIASELGKTTGAVNALCHRGLKTLRELLIPLTRYMTKH